MLLAPKFWSFPPLISPSAPTITDTVSVFFPHILVGFNLKIFVFWELYNHFRRGVSVRWYRYIYKFNFIIIIIIITIIIIIIIIWLDDAAVISGQESENQHLINRFIIWCNWSNMIIRVDKCSTFGIRKLCTKSVQYLPKLLINGVLIPCVEMGESFRYLGRFFDFNMFNNQHMSELSFLVQDLMNDIDIKPLS